jgi:hypothetical protein
LPEIIGDRAPWAACPSVPFTTEVRTVSPGDDVDPDTAAVAADTALAATVEAVAGVCTAMPLELACIRAKQHKAAANAIASECVLLRTPKPPVVRFGKG